MNLTQQIIPGINTIRAFEKGKIKINEKFYDHSLLVTAEVIRENWSVRTADELTVEIIAQLLEFQPEIILIGSGPQHHFLDPLMSLAATQQGIGIEIMTTEAACLTYNVLLGEDRVVLAALMI